MIKYELTFQVRGGHVVFAEMKESPKGQFFCASDPAFMEVLRAAEVMMENYFSRTGNGNLTAEAHALRDALSNIGWGRV